MSFLSDFIVYIWLLPVALQILIPLAMFLGYTIFKVVNGIVRQEKVINEKIASLSTSATKESA